MRRIALGFLLVAGLAAQGCGTLLEDTVWGDAYSFFFKSNSVKAPVADSNTSSLSYSAQSPSSINTQR